MVMTCTPDPSSRSGTANRQCVRREHAMHMQRHAGLSRSFKGCIVRRLILPNLVWSVVGRVSNNGP